jgi:bifunctional oligoribonuclease and PAP phosphatase NrnA
MNEILRHLKKTSRVLVASHVNPDGDAVGSLVAVGMLLEAMGKRAILFNESPIPAVYRFLPRVDRIRRRVPASEEYDTAVVLDCGDLARTGETGVAAVARAGTVVNVDHHVTNTGFGHLRLIDIGACATAELVYRLATASGLPVDRDMATAIYTGIFTDTGSFRFANTNRAAFAICHEMVVRGAEPYRVAERVYGSYSLGRIKLLNLALDSLWISPDGRWSFMVVTREMFAETGTRPEDVDGMIHYAKRIRDVQVATLIQESPGPDAPDGTRTLHASLRSDGAVDVSALATVFGGGGHPRAAGFSASGSAEALKAAVLDWLEERGARRNYGT